MPIAEARSTCRQAAPHPTPAEILAFWYSLAAQFATREAA
jgi:hypothetical protein